MSIPKGIQFKSVKPQGFKQEYRDYFITPVQTYTNQFSVYDIVRIQFNLQDWYIDPYESYIEAEVRLENETKVEFVQANQSLSNNPVQFLMMDGPSTSLINDFRFEVNSKEIERIREYDQVGNLLTDLCLYPDAVDQKDYEGMYTVKGNPTLYNSINTVSSIKVLPSATAATNFQWTQQGTNINIIPAVCITPSTDPFIKRGGTYSISNTGTSAMTSFEDIAIQSTQNASGASAAKSFYSPIGWMTECANTNLLNDGNQALSGVYSYEQFLGQITAGNTNFGINSADISNGSQTGYMPCSQSPKLSQIDGHNAFLTNLPTSKIVNGKFQSGLYGNSDLTQCSRQYLQIPLLSGVMGVLIPSERWQLIPSSSLGQVNMEFRFNPNAFFSHDGTEPKWIVTKFQLRLRMYRFDEQIMRQLKDQVDQGVQLHSQVFSMGPIYNIQQNTSITNNWQLNNGIPSIKQLFFWFLSNDYETKWFCRKNFKLSQNVTSMQLKVGSTYLPQNPILGHAGNIVMNQKIQQDNSVYLSELHQAMNILFDCKRHISINKLNFAINDRPYDITLTKIFGQNLTGLAQQVMIKCGYTLWNEMRCRGKAIYAFNLEMDKRNDDTMTGMDTTKVRPIELILKNDDGNYFPRQSTMYVMFLSDFIVTFKNGEVVTEGAG